MNVNVNVDADGDDDDDDDSDDDDGKSKKGDDDSDDDDDDDDGKNRSALAARPEKNKPRDEKPGKAKKPVLKKNPNLEEQFMEIDELFAGILDADDGDDLLVEKESISDRVRRAKEQGRRLKRMKHKIKRGKKLASKKVAGRGKADEAGHEGRAQHADFQTRRWKRPEKPSHRDQSAPSRTG